MTHINPANFCSVTGRIAKDAVLLKNADGSHKVLFTVMADRGYKDRNGKVPSDAVQLETFVNKDNDPQKSPYVLFTHKGDQVQVTYESRSDSYEKNGQTVYTSSHEPTSIKPLESRTTTQARMAKRINDAGQTNEAAAQAPAEADAEAAQAPVQEALPFGG